MTTQTYDRLLAGDYNTTTRLKLTSLSPTFSFSTLLPLSPALTTLDLSSPHLTHLPTSISTFTHLKILFLSNCAFKTFPDLSQCPALEMVAFKSNGMTSIPENHLPPNLRWLILTNNAITSLPSTIGLCKRLQKCMLAGNKLKTLPSEMKSCTKLGLLRISVNEIQTLPSWLLDMPELSFLAFAGNPCAAYTRENPVLEDIAWSKLDISEVLGEGASGIISRGTWTHPSPSSPQSAEKTQVAIKLFKGEVTSDGAPADEMSACIAAGKHTNLINPLGKIHGHPEKQGLVLELIPPSYTNLGQPPNLDTCTRDTYPPGTQLQPHAVLEILRGIASAAAHLHGQGISHGDLYAHNILLGSDGHALLGDFGAATVYRGCGYEKRLERLEVLAFAHLVEDMLGLIGEGEEGEDVRRVGREIWRAATNASVEGRPSFMEIVDMLMAI